MIKFLREFIVLSILELCLIHACRGMTMLTSLPVEYRPGSTCFGKHVRSFRVMHLSHCTIPWYFKFFIIALAFNLGWL